MKKTLYIISLLCLATAGCKRDLNIIDPNSPTQQTFWKSANDALQGLNAVYSTYHRPGLCRWLYFITIIRSDEGYSTSPNTDIINVYDKFNITDYNDGQITSTYDDCYVGINRCNQVLDNVPNIDMDATLKQQYLGEAQFMRGLFYFILATNYGNVPLMLHASTPQDYPPTSSQDSVFTRVETDLTAAAAVLPASYDAGNVGRATKGAAYALLGKAYMQQHKYAQPQAALQWLVEGY